MAEIIEKGQAVDLSVIPKDLLGKLDKSIGNIIDPYIQRLINMPGRNIMIVCLIYYFLAKKRPA